MKHQEVREIQKISENFINNLIETCLRGDGEISIERMENRTALIIKLGNPTCIYKSDSTYLKCAVNPLGDCETCQYKETK